VRPLITGAPAVLLTIEPTAAPSGCFTENRHLLQWLRRAAGRHGWPGAEPGPPPSL